MSSINVPQRRLIEGSISKSDEGAAKLKQMTAVMSITESAAKVKNLVDEVSAGNQEEAQGVEQISKTMLELERATQSSEASRPPRRARRRARNWRRRRNR